MYASPNIKLLGW